MGLAGRKASALACGVAFAVIATAAAAQEQATTQQPILEGKQGRVTLLQRIILGAGQKKIAIDTPQSVSVVDQADIDRTQATTVNDIIKTIPGVKMSGSERALGQSFNIRGVGGPDNSGDEGRIIVKVDGVDKFYEQYRMGGFYSDPELYKRVEVLRGPASSTLYGSGALGGVVNFTTKEASDFIAESGKGSLKLKSTYDSNGTGWLGSVTLAQKLTDDTDFLFSGNYRTSDNFETGNGSEVRSSFFDTWSGLAKLTSKIGDEGKLELSYQHWDSDAEGQDLVQTSSDTPPFGVLPTFGLVDRHIVDDTARIAYSNPFSDNDWLDLKVHASYSRTWNEQRNATGNPAFGLTCATSQLFCDADYGYGAFQFDVQNTMDFAGDAWENHLTYGWQFARQERTAEILNGRKGVGFHPEGHDLRNGLFVQNEFIWDEKLTLIPGIRFDFRTLSPGDNVATTENFSETATSPKIAAHYRFNDTVAVFGSFAHTERFPTIDEVFSTSGSAYTFDPSFGLTKEKSDNFEGGVALSGYDLAQDGDSLQFKATAFHNTIEDLIALNPALRPGPNPGVPGFINVNNARIYGIELEAAYDSDYVFANAAYTHTIGTNLDTDVALTTVAPHELAFTLGGRLPDRQLEFGWKGRFVGAPRDKCRDASATVTCTGGNSSRFSESFNVHDAFVSWKPDEGQFTGFEANFSVENIFDKQYKEFLSNDFAKGRTFKVSLAKQIGW